MVPSNLNVDCVETFLALVNWPRLTSIQSIGILNVWIVGSFSIGNNIWALTQRWRFHTFAVTVEKVSAIDRVFRDTWLVFISNCWKGTGIKWFLFKINLIQFWMFWQPVIYLSKIVHLWQYFSCQTCSIVLSHCLKRPNSKCC